MAIFGSLCKKEIIIRVLFCLSIIVFIASYFLNNKSTLNTSNLNSYEGIHPDFYATLGSDKVFDPEMLNISISSDITVNTKTYTGRANIMNIQNDDQVIKVDLTLNETNELIYQSNYIKSEEMVEFIELTTQLEPGTYPVTATFKAFDKDSMEYITSIVVDITITIVKAL